MISTQTVKKQNVYIQKLLILTVIVVVAAVVYQFINVDMKHFNYAMKIRTPKLIVMMIAAFCIGTASIVFQSIINNTIVTPCLLGMNGLYILIHTLVVFVLGAAHPLVINKLSSFGIDLVIMAVAAIVIYGFLFKKSGGNVLYILLIGTVMATLFGSITSTLQRIMDPNEFSSLQNALIASFHKVNSSIIVVALVAIATVILLLWKDLKLLDVITLGRDHAINLGVDYNKTVSHLLLGVAVLIAVATAMVGPISFMGLVVANLSRQLFKTYRHVYLTIGSALIGMVILLVGQSLIEHVFSFTANISAFINVGGGLYFLYLLMKNRG